MARIQDAPGQAPNPIAAAGPPPAPSDSSNAPSPIGVPKGFMANALATHNGMDSRGALQHAGSYMTPTAPRYFSGAEWLPASLGPDGIAQIQKGMVAAGLLAPGDAQTGVWDANSVKAYKELLSEANASGMDVTSMMMRRIQSTSSTGVAGAAGKGAKGPGGLQIQLTSDADLDKAFRSSFIDLTGRGPTQDEVNKMIAGYHGAETIAQTQAQQQANQAANAGPDQSFTSTQAPTAASYGEQQIRQDHPQDVQEHDFLKPGGLTDSFQAALAQWK